MRFDGYKREEIAFEGMKPNYIDDKGTAVWEAENIEPTEDIEAFLTDNPYYDLGSPFQYVSPECEAYETMGERLMRNFNIKQYNGATWWSHKLIDKFGDKQSDGFYYVVGVSYYKCKKYDKALEMLDKAAQCGEDEYFIPSIYCKALIYRKTNDMIKYRECLEALASYGQNGDDPNDYINWMQLWAQSRLDDLGEAC
jgi:tetratricopeptide (TPR) repeat protein